MAATLLWGWLVFGIELTIDSPLAFVLAVPATVVSIGALGFLLAVAFVRFRPGVGAREHARVPGLARLRLPRAR